MALSEVTIQLLRSLFAAGRFDISTHGVPHQLKEGFSIDEIVEAIKAGQIVEEYPSRKRCLVWGNVQTREGTRLDLHVVCEISDPQWVHVVTAYVPDPREWEEPPNRRRK